MRHHCLKLVGILSVVVAGFLLSPNFALAGTANNVRGIAYNSNNGYILFNCLDDDFAGRFTFDFTFAFYIIPCSVSTYGVTLDQNNNFTGNAWNEKLGYITFDSTSTPADISFRTNGRCNYKRADGSTNICDASNHCTACYNENDRKVYGYMKVLSTGEWIRLDDITGIISAADKLQINSYVDSNPGVFSGATMSNDGPIWFKGSFLGFDYGVKVWPLEIRQLTAPNWSSADACTSAANRATLSWALRSGEQLAYQVLISTQNNTSTANIVDDSGIVYNTLTRQYNSLSLAYGTHYYWFLKLWDKTGSSTPWRQFNTTNSSNGDLVDSTHPYKIGNKDWLTDNYLYNNSSSPDPALTFTSYRRRFPLPNFSAMSLVGNPTEFLIATTSNRFVSTSSYYDASNILRACDDAHCSYQWTTSDPGPAIIAASTTATTSIVFTEVANTKVELTAIDNTNGEGEVYRCSIPKYLNVNYSLPVWKETKAPNKTP